MGDNERESMPNVAPKSSDNDETPPDSPKQSSLHDRIESSRSFNTRLLKKAEDIIERLQKRSAEEQTQQQLQLKQKQNNYKVPKRPVSLIGRSDSSNFNTAR